MSNKNQATQSAVQFQVAHGGGDGVKKNDSVILPDKTLLAPANLALEDMRLI